VGDTCIEGCNPDGVLLRLWLPLCRQRAFAGRRDPGVHSILENRSAETGVETLFTNDLVYEFTRNRKDVLVRERSSADGILAGTIVRLSVENISRASLSTAVERRVTGTLNLQMESPDGRILWRSGNIIERQAYNVVDGNKTATDQNKSDAIAALSSRLAESAFNRLTDDF
jgi:hypothetical protein